MQAIAVTASTDGVMFRIEREHAIRLIKAFNKDFRITGFGSLSGDELWQEFLCEYSLFKKRLKRAPVNHVSRFGLWYIPQKPTIAYVQDGAYYCSSGKTVLELALFHTVVNVVKDPMILAIAR